MVLLYFISSSGNIQYFPFHTYFLASCLHYLHFHTSIYSCTTVSSFKRPIATLSLFQINKLLRNLWRTAGHCPAFLSQFLEHYFICVSYICFLIVSKIFVSFQYLHWFIFYSLKRQDPVLSAANSFTSL